MPTRNWLQQAFAQGYDSGDIVRPDPDEVRAGEERAIGGSYHAVFQRAMVPFLSPGSMALELGPGRGSWTRAMLSIVTHGVVHTIDYLDVTPWLEPARYNGRLVCHRSRDNSFDAVADASFDFCFSFGVLCHTNAGDIAEILANSRRKMRPGGVAVHQYGDWTKLDALGWERAGMPESFKDRPDDEIWWPRNSAATMATLAEQAGWTVIAADLQLLRRDALIVMRSGSSSDAGATRANPPEAAPANTSPSSGRPSSVTS
jgi:SAM-dependent methyltransferase